MRSLKTLNLGLFAFAVSLTFSSLALAQTTIAPPNPNCGDGIVDQSFGEECELPNTLGCDSECHSVTFTKIDIFRDRVPSEIRFPIGDVEPTPTNSCDVFPTDSLEGQCCKDLGGVNDVNNKSFQCCVALQDQFQVPEQRQCCEEGNDPTAIDIEPFKCCVIEKRGEPIPDFCEDTPPPPPPPAGACDVFQPADGIQHRCCKELGGVTDTNNKSFQCCEALNDQFFQDPEQRSCCEEGNDPTATDIEPFKCCVIEKRGEPIPDFCEDTPPTPTPTPTPPPTPDPTPDPVSPPASPPVTPDPLPTPEPSLNARLTCTAAALDLTSVGDRDVIFAVGTDGAPTQVTLEVVPSGSDSSLASIVPDKSFILDPVDSIELIQTSGSEVVSMGALRVNDSPESFIQSTLVAKSLRTPQDPPQSLFTYRTPFPRERIETYRFTALGKDANGQVLWTALGECAVGGEAMGGASCSLVPSRISTSQPGSLAFLVLLPALVFLWLLRVPFHLKK